MTNLLKELADRYDKVLIDMPPVLPVTDAAALVTRCDGVLFVVRHGKTSRQQVSTAVSTLAALSGDLLGLVLTMTPKGRFSSRFATSYNLESGRTESVSVEPVAAAPVMPGERPVSGERTGRMTAPVSKMASSVTGWPLPAWPGALAVPEKRLAGGQQSGSAAELVHNGELVESMTAWPLPARSSESVSTDQVQTTQRGVPPARPDLETAPLSDQSQQAPREVLASFWVWIVSFVTGLVATALAITQIDELRFQLEDSVPVEDQLADPVAFNTAVDILLLGSLAVPVVLVLLQLLSVPALRADRNWARVWLIVIGVLGVAATLLTFGIITRAAQGAMILQWGLGAGAIVLMFLPGANAWFRSRVRRESSPRVS